jgi:transcriptional regulator with XRE-family HTH domain
MSNYSSSLQQLMAQVGCPSYRALMQQSHLSRRQLQALRSGQGSSLSMARLCRLSEVLQVPLADLLRTFDIAILDRPQTSHPDRPETSSTANSVQTLKAECLRLQQQLEQQRSQLQQDFQRETLHTLESLLLMWPTAAHRAQQDPTLPAVKILPLLKPLEHLLRHWGVEAIGAVGEQTLYDPTLQQWNATGAEGPPQPGDAVVITHVGYRQGTTILYRAKVRSAK